MAWFYFLSTTTQAGINELTPGVDSNHGMVLFLKYNNTWDKRINTGCRLKSWHGFIKSKSLGTHGFSSGRFLIRLSEVSLYYETWYHFGQTDRW